MDRKTLDEKMLLLQKGDEKAFEDIYNETKRGLFSFILSICKNYHTAEDIMQTAYIRVRTAIGSYQAGSNALAWMYTIAKNLTINELNKQKREVFSDFEGSATQFGEYTLDDSLPCSLMGIMNSVLNENERQIISLYIISGFKHREIAEMLGKPLGTVLWAYRNALNKVKKQLEKDAADEI